MNHSQSQLFYNLINYGIKPEILECIPYQVTGIVRHFKDCYLLDSPSGVFALWFYQGQEASLAYHHQLLSICRQHKTVGFLYLIELTNGCTYNKLDEKAWFYLTEWLDFKKVSYRDSNHVKSMVDLIANFRGTISDLGLTFCLPDRKDTRNLTVKTAEAVGQLTVFALLAKHRLKPTHFDQLFLQQYPHLIGEAETGHQLFKKSAYSHLNANVTTQNINIGDFSRSNLRFGPDSIVYCLGLKNYRWDIPVIDLAEILVKTGRSNRWNINWFLKVIGYYEKYFSISKEELDIIKAYLSFPWSLYRLTSRFYLNKVDWPLSKFIEKFERVIIDETSRIKFIEQINLK